MKLHAPAAERNKAPILEALRTVVPAAGTILEVASGSGQHCVHFATHLPALTWQPSDASPAAVASIAAYAAEAELANLKPPLHLDATAMSWPVTGLAGVISCNMIHIAPWPAAEGLFRNAAPALALTAGFLFLYGPFFVDGQPTAPSNLAFDRSLREQNPGWGVRNLAAVQELATVHGFKLERTVPMPANNLAVIFRLA